MSVHPPVYNECLPEIARGLDERRAQGVVLVDLSFLEAVEEQYGTAAYGEVRQRIYRLLDEQSGKDFRATDRIAFDAPEGSGLLVFLDHKRRKAVAQTSQDLAAVAERFRQTLVRGLGRAAFPYLKSPPTLPVGYALALHNPLVGTHRVMRHAIDEARRRAEHQRATEALESRERLQDLIAGERIVTAYQPIMDLRQRSLLAVEALSRGARGTGLEAANLLFGSAARHELMIELDRLCRSRALLSTARIPRTARVFVNTLPATIRDPQFRGKPLIDFLDRAQVAPDRIVIEITEKLVIENYGLFLESMAYYSELGVSFAVDDVGSGYSGLEAISRLKPSFLKIDMSLVRNVHESAVNREMVKAIIALGEGIGAHVIAEGIEVDEELDALREMGVELGQGYLLARPEVAPEPAG